MKNEFKNHMEESLIEDVNYWTNKMSDISNYTQKKIALEVDKSKSFSSHKSKTKKIKPLMDYKIFEFAPPSIMRNEDLMLKAIESNFVYFFQLPDVLKNNKDFSLRYLNEVKHSYSFNLSEDVLEHEEIFKMCLERDARTYALADSYSHKLVKYKTIEKAFAFLKINPKVYEYFPNKYKENIELSKLAIELDLNNANFMRKSVSQKIFKNKELALKLIEKDIAFFPKIHNSFRKDELIMSEVVKKMPHFIEYASEDLRNKKSFVKLAVSAYNLLDYISDDFKKDPELMERFLANNPNYEWEVSKYLDVAPLFINIIKGSTYFYERLTEENKTKDEYVFAILEHNDYYGKIDSELKTGDWYSYGGYRKMPIFHILPTKLKSELMDEFYEKNPSKRLSALSSEEQIEECLSFARKKYVNIYMNKYIDNNGREKKKIKI